MDHDQSKPLRIPGYRGAGIGDDAGAVHHRLHTPSAGSYLFQVSYYDGPNFLIPANFAFAATTGMGAAFTSRRSGTWSVPSGTSTSP